MLYHKDYSPMYKQHVKKFFPWLNLKNITKQQGPNLEMDIMKNNLAVKHIVKEKLRGLRGGAIDNTKKFVRTFTFFKKIVEKPVDDKYQTQKKINKLLKV